MQEKNSIWGIGPKLLGSTAAYLLLVLYINKLVYQAAITEKVWIIYFISGVLILVGVVIWIIAGRTIVKMYKSESLYRTGLYAFCRHPLYANFMLTLVPGFCLLSNSWIILTTPLFMYFAFKYFIREEEQGLVEQFGQAYIEYRNEVNAIVPKIHI